MRIGTHEIVHTGYQDVMRNMPAGLLVGLFNRPADTSSQTRRREARVVEQNVCTYELCESIDEDAVVIQQGETYSLNRSPHGILLLMGYSPRLQQFIEIHAHDSRWRRSLNLYEVRWTRPVHVDSCGDLFLVGGQLVFGPSRYWAF